MSYAKYQTDHTNDNSYFAIVPVFAIFLLIILFAITQRYRLEAHYRSYVSTHSKAALPTLLDTSLRPITQHVEQSVQQWKQLSPMMELALFQDMCHSHAMAWIIMQLLFDKRNPSRFYAVAAVCFIVIIIMTLLAIEKIRGQHITLLKKALQSVQPHTQPIILGQSHLNSVATSPWNQPQQPLASSGKSCWNQPPSEMQMSPSKPEMVAHEGDKKDAAIDPPLNTVLVQDDTSLTSTEQKPLASPSHGEVAQQSSVYQSKEEQPPPAPHNDNLHQRSNSPAAVPAVVTVVVDEDKVHSKSCHITANACYSIFYFLAGVTIQVASFIMLIKLIMDF